MSCDLRGDQIAAHRPVILQDGDGSLIARCFDSQHPHMVKAGTQVRCFAFCDNPATYNPRLMTQEMDKRYSPGEIEQRWYRFWEAEGYFTPDVTSEKPPFSIVIPPPNVTGRLHIGHALVNSLQDFLVRWKRMSGFKTLWLPGTDHAGIATQMVVERELAKQGSSRHQLGREGFEKRVWQWKEEYGDAIVRQLKRLGVSCDWTRMRFTLDEGLSRAVRHVFVKLYEDGLIYRALAMVNWCPQCQTAISDIEVEHREITGKL